MIRTLRIVLCVGVGLLAVGCKKKTGALSADLLSRFEKEQVLHRADDLAFRRTNVGGGEKDSTWEETQASIVVTKSSVFLHENGKAFVEITPRSTGFYEVHRDHDRIALRAGSGKSATSWSFRPPDAAESWTDDIRAVIKNGAGRSSASSAGDDEPPNTTSTSGAAAKTSSPKKSKR